VTYSVATGWKFYVDGVEGTTADGTSCTTCSPAGSCPQSPGVEPRYDSIQHFGLGTRDELDRRHRRVLRRRLDEVRVWSRVLSAAEIASGKNVAMTSGHQSDRTFRPDENGGTSTANSVNVNTPGTLTGGGPGLERFRQASITGSCTHAAIAGCQHCNGTEECLDTNVCNGTAFCSGGICQPGTPLNCDEQQPVHHGLPATPRTAASTRPSAVTTDWPAPPTAATRCWFCQHVSTCPAGQACDPGVRDLRPELHDGRGVQRRRAPARPIPATPRTAYALQLNGTNQSVTMGPAPNLGVSAFTLETWNQVETGGRSQGSTPATSGLASAIPLCHQGPRRVRGSNVDMNYFLGSTWPRRCLAVDFEEGAGRASAAPTRALLLPDLQRRRDRPVQRESQCTSPPHRVPRSSACTWEVGLQRRPGLNHPLLGNENLSDADVVNQWNHVAATYDYSGPGTGTLRLYLNGASQGSLFVGRPLRADSIQHFGLGTALTSTGSTGGFFGGALDEVARVEPGAQPG
jgi:hypothetical protein